MRDLATLEKCATRDGGRILLEELNSKRQPEGVT